MKINMSVKIFAAATALLFASAVAATTVSPPANAAGVSYLSSPSGWTPMYYAPNTQYSNVKVWDSNGTKFQMICWLDNAGHRWFYGQEFSRGYYGYVTAGYVYNQARVGHC